MSNTAQLTVKEQEKSNIMQSLLNGTITNAQAATILKLSLRQIKRLKRKVREQGTQAVIHQLKGKPSNHHLDLAVKEKALGLVKDHYADFKPTFASEKLAEKHGLIVNSQTLRKWMIKEGLWKPRQQKESNYRSFRERLEYFGEMEQFDGCYHLWFENRLLDELGNPLEICLLAAIDDATSQITYAKFDFNEGVKAVFFFWWEYIGQVGKPLKVYLDKFSTYKVNHKSAVDNSELLTQFQTAMRLLNIETISANSPEAKGRVERLFLTLQDRLVKELRLANISTVEEGNQFLKEFIPKFNSRFSVRAKKNGDVHRLLSQEEKQSLGSILSIKSQRRINNDFTIQFKNHFYQLEEIQPLTVRPKEKVRVEEHLDNTVHFSIRGKKLKYFTLLQKPQKIAKQPVILTNHPLNYKPPANHPWRSFRIKSTNSGG